MIIDLSEWNEYIADDVPPGPIPIGIKLETMQIVGADSYIEEESDIYHYPQGLRADLKSIKMRLFWRIKK